MTKTVKIADELVAMQQAVEHAQGKHRLRSHEHSHRYRATQIRKICERLKET
jgi:hypothetical protein